MNESKEYGCRDESGSALSFELELWNIGEMEFHSIQTSEVLSMPSPAGNLGGFVRNISLQWYVFFISPLRGFWIFFVSFFLQIFDPVYRQAGPTGSFAFACCFVFYSKIKNWKNGKLEYGSDGVLEER